MSGIIYQAKDAVSSLTGSAELSNGAGEFAKPKDFSSQTQRGTVVGLQHAMNDQPLSVHMEGPNGSELYKPGGKTSSLHSP